VRQASGNIGANIPITLQFFRGTGAVAKEDSSDNAAGRKILSFQASHSAAAPRILYWEMRILSAT